MKVPHTKDSKIIQIKEKAKELSHLKIDCIFNTHSNSLILIHYKEFLVKQLVGT